MKIDIVGSTNHFNKLEDSLEFGATAARICYSKFSWGKLEKEDKKKLIERTLTSGHHSPFDHAVFNLYIEGIPKMGAMILNNEKMYTTSEKSARYTQMSNLDPQQKSFYDKWMKNLVTVIGAIPELEGSDDKVKKLAQENARYMTSVFSPTVMLHTVSFRQVNHLMHWFDEFIENAEDNVFNNSISSFMEEFNDSLKPLFYVPELKPSMKKRTLSLFAKRKKFNELFDEVYSTSYQISLAGLAQAQRHRTLNYEMQPIELGGQKFFVPPVVMQNPDLAEEWKKDISIVGERDIPQASLAQVHETGNYSDFISKMNERLCGHAQWEMMNRTRKILEQYVDGTEGSNHAVHEELKGYLSGPRCTWKDTKCNGGACDFGPKGGLERIV